MRIGVYGNLTLDELEKDGKSIVRPGGSALFSSLAASHLGARVSIVSNIGNDYPGSSLSRLQKQWVDIGGVSRLAGRTTRFRISYRNGSRKLVLVYPGHRLKPFKPSPSFQAIHLGPVFREVGPETLNHARHNSDFVSVDVQGLLRSVDRYGRVGLVKRDIDPFLAQCNLVKATEEEARLIAPAGTVISRARRLLAKGAEYAIITRGRSGSVLAIKDDRILRIPSVPERHVIDPTGAGDVFIGSWLATFIIVRDARWAGAVGAAFASLAVRDVGAAKFRFSRSELFRRASWAYMNSKRLYG